MRRHDRPKRIQAGCGYGEFVAVGRSLRALRRAGCPTAPAPAPSIDLGPGFALALCRSATLRSTVRLPMRPLALPMPASAHRSAPWAPALARTRDGRLSGARWAKPHRITRSGPSRVPWRNVHERQRSRLTRPCHGQLNSQPASTAIRAGAAPDLIFTGDPTAWCGTRRVPDGRATGPNGRFCEGRSSCDRAKPHASPATRGAVPVFLWRRAARHSHSPMRASIVCERQMGG